MIIWVPDTSWPWYDPLLARGTLPFPLLGHSYLQAGSIRNCSFEDEHCPPQPHSISAGSLAWLSSQYLTLNTQPPHPQPRPPASPGVWVSQQFLWNFGICRTPKTQEGFMALGTCSLPYLQPPIPTASQ